MKKITFYCCLKEWWKISASTTAPNLIYEHWDRVRHDTEMMRNCASYLHTRLVFTYSSDTSDGSASKDTRFKWVLTFLPGPRASLLDSFKDSLQNLELFARKLYFNKCAVVVIHYYSPTRGISCQAVRRKRGPGWNSLITFKSELAELARLQASRVLVGLWWMFFSNSHSE